MRENFEYLQFFGSQSEILSASILYLKEVIFVVPKM